MLFCMVTTFYPPKNIGGDGVYVCALSEELAARGHHVEVVHCSDAYRMQNIESNNDQHSLLPATRNGVLVHSLHSPLGAFSPILTQQLGDPALKRPALRKILNCDFDVVHFHNISLVGGPKILTYSRAPVTLYTTHEHWLLCAAHIFWKNKSRACDKPHCFRCCLRSGIPPQLWRATSLLQRCMENVDLLLCPSEYSARRHRDAGFKPPIQVLPLFTKFDEILSEKWKQSERPRFLFVGQMTRSKGVFELARSFSRLPEYDFFFVGEGDACEPLQRHYANYKNLFFLGAQHGDALAKNYQSTNALIVPSLAPETFGLVTIEAMSHGTPVIVRDAGGARESVDATGGGFVYQTEPEFLKAVHQLANNADVRARLSTLARAGYEKYFTPQRHIENYLAKIEAIAATKNAKLRYP